MGLKDVLSFTIRKVKPTNTAEVISCISVIIGIVFAVIAFFVAVASRNNFAPDRLLTSLVVDGMKQSPPTAPIPQYTFCPWDQLTTIQNVECRAANDNHEMHMQMPYTMLGNCWAFNQDGTQIPDVEKTMFCWINATTSDLSKAVVRVFIDVPKTTSFANCESCVDGVDGTVAVAGYFTVAFFQANVVDSIAGGNPVTDYKTSQNRMPLETRTDQRGPTSSMVFLGGFFTPDVWKYQMPTDFQAAINGEQFGQFTALVGGLGLVAWAIYACLSTTLILVVVGADGLPASHKRTPLL